MIIYGIWRTGKKQETERNKGEEESEKEEQKREKGTNI
jgi:hypothetical protein